VGYWYVAPHPLKPETSSRVFYSVKLLPGELVPSFVVDILQKQVRVDIQRGRKQCLGTAVVVDGAVEQYVRRFSSLSLSDDRCLTSQHDLCTFTFSHL
jgi:hypothetical protein